MNRAVVRLPDTFKIGEVIEVTAMASHPMETGYRTGDDGRIVPRHILSELRCDFDGQLVFRMALFPAITANPWVAFPLRVDRAGLLSLTWTDDRGQAFREQIPLQPR
jgi:sulfur-oxidizing protein SoxZ